ncbi:nucleotidyltransferase domain-containing protein [Thioalkalivibrio thiocyanodenitrificans]|uniref:nucleotidyltransferase domain-containing protein n=1 Tax=Thioalkalivibrio thiocyanodenitrificans TaxID=243063 RepID=UPI000366CE90|nr:nucleotidyltransferase family protein [Thioalkalivibrio thiocyanodenitrificans]
MNTRGPDPELGLLLALGRSRLAADRAVALEARLARPFDAPRLHRLAAEHGLMPLLYRHLVMERPDALPAESAAAVAHEFRQHAISRWPMARRLRELLQVLRDAGVTAMPYKGPALATQLFGNYAMRQYGDLDILVRPSQVSAAVERLQAHGLSAPHGVPADWDGFVRRTRHDYAMRDRRTGTLVELHWGLTYRYQGFGVDPEWLLNDPVEVDYLGVRIACMNPSAQLLALAVHGVKHQWERLGWLVDVAELMSGHDPDWDWIDARARAIGFTRAWRSSLLLCDTMLGLPDTVPMSQARRDRPAARLARRLAREISRDDPRPIGFVTRLRFDLLARPGAAAKLVYLSRLLTLPSEADLAGRRVSTAWAATYAVTRPLRLLRKMRRQGRR